MKAIKSILALVLCAIGLAVRGSEEIAAESDEFAVDLRPRVEFEKGKTRIDVVTWSATAWGAVPGSKYTDLGFTNLTTGATGVIAEGLVGENLDDCPLPEKDGEYLLTHSTGDLKSFATFIVSGTGNPVGSQSNPWVVGKTADDSVVAYTNGIGGLVVEGEGDMKDFDPPGDPAPWGTDITEVKIGEWVTGIGAKAFAGCTSLSSVTVGAMMPPALGADALADTAEDLKIAVPSGAGEAYKAASGWSIYADGIVEQGSPESPWELGGGVTAWVDPALTNIVGLVICNGLPDENRPIDLDALAAAMEKAKYLPAVTPLNALVVTGGDSAAMPAKWVDGNTGMPYGNLEAAVNYGVAAVTPDFGSAEDPVPPRMVVEEGVGEDGGIYTAVVENDVSGVRSNAVWASCAGGLIDVATALDTNVTLKVVAKDAADVDPAVAEAISNRLAEVSAGGKGFDSVAFVDLSVFFNREKQENCELGSPVALHLSWPVTAGGTYGIARMHGGVVQAIPQGAENAVDGEFFTVDVAAGEIVLCVNKFSVYALGSTDGSGMLDPSALGEVKYPNTKNVKGVRQEFLLEKATATWIAKPYDACVFAGWAWTNGTPSEAFAALSENELKGKTLKLKIAAGEKVRPTDIGAVWARIDEDLLGEVTLTPTGLVTESKSYVTATVSGLPSGLRFDKKTLAIGWRGKTAPKDATDKEVKVRVKNAAGYTFKQTYLVTVTGGVVAKIVPADDAVRTGEPVMLWGDAALGKVKGSKVYVAGRKASLRATPAKGSIFLGWYEDPTFANAATNLPKGYLTASQSVVVPADGGLHLFARFVELEDWAVGTFDGICYEAVNGTNVESGTVTLTVSSKGKVMGKVRTGGKTYSFFAKTIADAFEVDGRYSFVAYPVMKVGRESREIVISISRNESTGLGVAEILFDEETGGSFSEAVQNGWKLRPSALPAFPTGKAALTLDLDNGLKLKFGAKGVVSFSGKVMGDNGQPVSVSGSTCVLPVAWYSTMTPNLFARVYVYVAPKKNLATGFCEVCDILLKVGASGKFDTATVAPPEW